MSHVGGSAIPISWSQTEKPDLEVLDEDEVLRHLLKPVDVARLPAMTLANDPERPGERTSLDGYDQHEFETDLWGKDRKQKAAMNALGADMDEEAPSEERISARRKVQLLDELLDMDRSLPCVPTPGMGYLIKQAQQLRKMQFFATYRDFFPESCEELNDAVKENGGLRGHNSVSTLWWTEVQKKIREGRDMEAHPDQPFQSGLQYLQSRTAQQYSKLMKSNYFGPSNNIQKKWSTSVRISI